MAASSTFSSEAKSNSGYRVEQQNAQQRWIVLSTAAPQPPGREESGKVAWAARALSGGNLYSGEEAAGIHSILQCASEWPFTLDDQHTSHHLLLLSDRVTEHPSGTVN